MSKLIGSFVFLLLSMTALASGSNSGFFVLSLFIAVPILAVIMILVFIAKKFIKAGKGSDNES